jgi:hypothetical protein
VQVKAEHVGRGPRAAMVWSVWAVLFVLSAVGFSWCFNVTYMTVLGHMHESIARTHARINQELELGTRQGDPADPFRGYTPMEQRTLRRLYAYGIGYDFRWQWERPGNNMANVYHWTAILFVLLCPPVAFVLLRFARSRLHLCALDYDERMFQLRMVMRLAVPLMVLAAGGGALAAAGLTGTRLLQIRYQPDFNDDLAGGQIVRYHRDYLGRGIATFISCAAMLAIVTWGLYPFFARRTLKQLGRCAKCAYPRGDNTTCPECGSSHA